ncbi:hypothetical protein BKA57DRAFT_421059 [Linnemannia elongata]|nr:hypothetical protein BKA57DRAFT_421059 [Linnemannia elongata]
MADQAHRAERTHPLLVPLHPRPLLSIPSTEICSSSHSLTSDGWCSFYSIQQQQKWKGGGEEQESKEKATTTTQRIATGTQGWADSSVCLSSPLFFSPGPFLLSFLFLFFFSPVQQFSFLTVLCTLASPPHSLRRLSPIPSLLPFPYPIAFSEPSHPPYIRFSSQLDLFLTTPIIAASNFPY